MKYLLTLIAIGFLGLQLSAQHQLELMVPVGLSGFTNSTQNNIRDIDPEATYTFGRGLATGASLRYAFGLQNRFHMAAVVKYQRLNVTYSRRQEITEPNYLLRIGSFDYTENIIGLGLNYRYRILENRNQGLALQLKTHLAIPFAGEYQLEESRKSDTVGEPQIDTRYYTDLIYDEEFNMHLDLGGGLLYTYHFSNLAVFAEANYLYKYHISGHPDVNDIPVDWSNVYLGVGIGYSIIGGDRIEGDQDAFFKK